MKKLVLILLLLINMVAFAPEVQAATSFTTSLGSSKTINAGSTFSVTVTIKSTTALCGIDGQLSYNSNKMSYVSASELNGFSLTVGSNVIALHNTGKSGTFSIATITFRAKSTFTAGQSETIKFGDSSNEVDGSTCTSTTATGSSSTVRITVATPKSSNNNLSALRVDGVSVPNFSGSTTSYNLGSVDKTSVTIAATTSDTKAKVSGIGTKNLVYGLNSFPIVVTAENGATKTYTVAITRNDPRSTNNFLSGITLSSGTLDFNKETGSYVVEVENDVTSITIGANVEDAKSSLVGTGTFDLNLYDNKFELTVTAENQTTRTYALNIVRKDELGFSHELSKNNYLSSLTIEGLEFPFVKETNSYVLTVEKDISTITINAVADDPTASVESVTTAELAYGQNAIRISVIAESGAKRDYFLFVYRKSDAPVVSVDDILTYLDTSTDKTIILVPGISGIISQEILEKAALKGITLQVEKRDDLGKVIYVWNFAGKAGENFVKTDTNLGFTSPNAKTIHELSNYASGMMLYFNHEGELSSGTSIDIFVGEVFDDLAMVNLYHFDVEAKKLVKSGETLEVKNGFVRLDLSHASEYLLTQAILKDTKTYSIFFVAMVAEAGIILGLVILMIVLLRRKRKSAE